MFASINAMRRDVSRRLRRGEHVVLYGPWGSGKTTILIELEKRFKEAGIPCGLSPVTGCVEDILGALESAYPAVEKTEVDAAARRARLLAAAEGKAGILLLDHLTDASNAMARFLRRLHHGSFGVLAAVDLELEQESRRLKPWRLGSLAVRMPPESPDRLAQLLDDGRTAHQLSPLKPEFTSQLIRTAQGRPGWIRQCIEMERRGHYWQDGQLFVTRLCEDTDAAMLRASVDALGLERAPDGEGP